MSHHVLHVGIKYAYAYTHAPHQQHSHLLHVGMKHACVTSDSLHFCPFAFAFNNCKPHRSAKFSKKRSKTFHLAVKGIKHTSRWLKLESQQQVQNLLRTPPAQAVDDLIQTAAGTLFFKYKPNRRKPWVMAGQLEITEHVLTIVNHISTNSGRQGDPRVMSSDKNTAKGSQPQAKSGRLIFFLCFTMQTRGPQKDFSIVSQHDAVEWRKRTSTSVSFVVQPARGEGTRRPGTGSPPRRSWRGLEKIATRRTEGAYHAYGVMKHPSIVPCMVNGARNTAAEVHTAGPSLNMLNRKLSGRGLGTCGCVDHMQNFGPQSVESINTSAAHILERVNLKLGRVNTSSHSLGIDGATWLAEIRAPERRSMGQRLLLQCLPAAWNCSFIQRYEKQVSGVVPAIVASNQQPNSPRAYTKSGCFNAYTTRIQDSGTLCRRQRRKTINKTTCLCIYTSVNWRSAYFVASCQQSLSHGCVTHTHSCASTAAVRTCVASRRLPAVDVYLHAYSGEPAQRLPALPPLNNPPAVYLLTNNKRGCSTLQMLPLVDTCPGRVPARASGRVDTALLVLNLIDKRSWTSICTHARASWHSAYRCCLLLTIGPSCVGQSGTAPTGVASCWRPAPAVYSTHTRASLLTAYQHCLLFTTGLGRGYAQLPGQPGTAFAGVDSRRQADLTLYLQACTDKLAQRLQELHPVDIRPQLCHASLCSAYRHCLLLTTRPQLCNLHAYSASLLTAYRHCPLLTTGHWCVPARMPGWGGTGLPALPLVVKRPWTCTPIRASASWRGT